LGKIDSVQPHPQAVPNAEKATIKDEKFSKYVLDPQSEGGQHKAIVYKAVLGFDLTNYADLVRQIRLGVVQNPAKYGSTNDHGHRYTTLVSVTGPNGNTANVTTGWIIRPDTDIPDLVTAYIKTKGAKK
jgi:filamentous hemagglutinin